MGYPYHISHKIYKLNKKYYYIWVYTLFMSILKPQTIQSIIQDLEASRNNQYNRYLLNKISVINEGLIKSKDKNHGERYKEIKSILAALREPHDISTGNLIDAEAKAIILDLYDELIEILKSHL